MKIKVKTIAGTYIDVAFSSVLKLWFVGLISYACLLALLALIVIYVLP